MLIVADKRNFDLFKRRRRGRVAKIAQDHKPIYHLNIKNINKSNRAVTSVAAYASGSRIYDEELQTTFNYSSKDEVIHSEILLPPSAPKEFQNRLTLWNEVTKNEKRKNAKTAKLIELALPQEFSLEESQQAVRNLLRPIVNSGYIADWSIHDKGDGNPHVHILITTRALDKNGNWTNKESLRYKHDANGDRIPKIDPETGKQKIGARGRKLWEVEHVKRNWITSRTFLTNFRSRWTKCVNELLPAETDKKIDHRSYKAQGIEKIPQRHEGVFGRWLRDKQQKNSFISFLNDNIREYNSDRERELEKLKKRTYVQKLHTIAENLINAKITDKLLESALNVVDRNRLLNLASVEQVSEHALTMAKKAKAMEIQRQRSQESEQMRIRALRRNRSSGIER